MILRLEVGRYNSLLSEIRLSLLQVQQALCGEIVMSPEIESVFDAILENQVSSIWNSESNKTENAFSPKSQRKN